MRDVECTSTVLPVKPPEAVNIIFVTFVGVGCEWYRQSVNGRKAGEMVTRNELPSPLLENCRVPTAFFGSYI